MNAELFLLRKRIDMAPQARRRWLVVLIYVTLAAAMAGLWFLDHWHTSAAYLILATIPINRFFLGGYNFGGLIKPFSGKRQRRSEAPPNPLLLTLRVYRIEPTESQYRSDERELAQRDRAHYRAYGALVVATCMLWLVTHFEANIPNMLARIAFPVGTVLYGLATATLIASITLPQSILLWTEPDMEEAESSAA
ncbi:MAG: hypothetical protein ABSB60_13750 [Terracidiphilus sp.]|jgi:hypothetical protein